MLNEHPTKTYSMKKGLFFLVNSNMNENAVGSKIYAQFVREI